MEKRIQFRRTDRTELETQFWLRTFAFGIDSFIVRLVFAPLVAITLIYITNTFDLWFIEPLNKESILSFQSTSAVILISYLIAFIVYSSILECSKLQGTIGKWFMRYRVFDKNSQRISFLRSLLRNSLKVISIASVVGVLLIDMLPKRQGLHDLIAGTVIRRR